MTTCLKDFNECSKNCAHRPERTKNFLTNFLLMDMFILAWGIQFGPPSFEGYTEKTKIMFPGRPKNIRKSKISFKIFHPIAHLGTKEQIWYQGCKISAANKTFPCPKSEVVSQSQHIVFVKVFLWTCKMPFWRFCWNFSPKFETFWLKMRFWRLLKYFRREFNKCCLKNKTKLKNQQVFDKNSSKSSRDA